MMKLKFNKDNKYIKRVRYSRIYGKCWKLYTYIRWLYCYYKNNYYRKFNYIHINLKIICVYIKLLCKVIIIKLNYFFSLIISFNWFRFYVIFKKKIFYMYMCMFCFIRDELHKYVYNLFKLILILYTLPYMLTIHLHVWIFSKIYFFIFRCSITETKFFKYFKYHNSLFLKQIIALPIMLYISVYNYRSLIINLFFLFSIIINIFFVFINKCLNLLKLCWYKYNILYKLFLKSKFLFCFFYDYGEYKRFLKRFFFVKYFFVPILIVYLYIIAYIYNPFKVTYFIFSEKYFNSIKYMIKYKFLRKWFFVKFEIIDLWLDFLIKYLPILLKFFNYVVNNLFNIVLKCSDIYYDKEIFNTYVSMRDRRWMYGISPDIVDTVLETDYDKIILKTKYRYYMDSWLISKTFFEKNYDELFSCDFMYKVQIILSYICTDIKYMFRVYDWFCRGKVDFFFFKLVYMMIYHKIYDEYNSEINLFNIVKDEKIFFYWLEFQKRRYWKDNLVKLVYSSNGFEKVFYRINYYLYTLFFIFPLSLLVNIGFINPFFIFKIGYYFVDTRKKFKSINLYYTTYIKILLCEFYFFRKFFVFVRWLFLWRKRLFVKKHRIYYFNKCINEVKFNFLLFVDSNNNNSNLGFFFFFMSFVFSSMIKNNFFARLIYFLFKYIILYIYICIVLFIIIFYLNFCFGISLYIPEFFFDSFFLLRLTLLYLIDIIYNVCIYFIQVLHVESWRSLFWYFSDFIIFFGLGELLDKFINFEYFSMLCITFIYEVYKYIGIYMLYPIIYVIDYTIVFFLKFLSNFILFYNLLSDYSGGFLEKLNESVWFNVLYDYKVNLNSSWFIILSNYENDLNWQVFDQFVFYTCYKKEFLKPCLLILYECNHELMNNYNLISVLILIIDNLINFLFKLVCFNIDLFSYLIFNILPVTLFNVIHDILYFNSSYYHLIGGNNLLIFIKLYIINIFSLDKFFYVDLILLLNELSFSLTVFLNWFFIFLIDLPIRIVSLLTVIKYGDSFILYYINLLISLYEIFVYFFYFIGLIVDFLIDLISFFYKFFLIILFNIFENDVLDIFLENFYLLYINNESYIYCVKWYVDKLYLFFSYIDSLINYILISIILELYVWFVVVPYCFVVYLYHTFMMYFYKFIIFLVEPYVVFMLHLTDLFFIYFSILKYLFTIDLLCWYRDFVYRLYLYAYNIIYILPIVVWISLIVRLVYSILFLIKCIMLYVTYFFFKGIILFIFYLFKYFVYLLSIVFFYLDISNLVELSNLLTDFNLNYLLFIELIDLVGAILVSTYVYVIDIIFFMLFDLDYGTDLLFDYVTYIYMRLHCYNYWNRIIDAIFNINIFNSMIYYYLVLHYFWLIRISWRRLEKVMFPERFIIKIEDDELSIEALWNKYKYEMVGKNKKALFLSFNEYCFFYTIDLVKYLSKYSDHPLSKRLSKEAFFLNEFSFSVNPYAEVERNDELNFIQIWLRRLIGKVFIFKWMLRSKLNGLIRSYLYSGYLNYNYIFFKKNVKYIINYYYNNYRFFIFYMKKNDFSFKNCISMFISNSYLLRSTIDCYMSILLVKRDKLLDNVFDLIDCSIDRLIIFYKNFYWEYIFNFDLKLNALLYRYNRFINCFKQGYLCISYRIKYKGKDFYKKEDFISYTVQLEQSILNRGILVGNVYKYKLVKNKLLRRLNRNLFNDINLVNFNEIYMNEAKLKFLCGYETNNTFWNEELGKSIIEVYSQYNKYIMDIIQFPVMPDLTGFVVHLTNNDILLSFEKYSLRRNSHFNEFFEELEKGTTKLSIFKNTRFLFKDFDRMGIYSITNIPHLNALSFEYKNDNVYDEEANLFAKEISNRLVSLSVSYKNYFLKNSNIMDDISPINMSDRYQVGLVGNFVLSQVEDQYLRYLKDTIFSDPWVKYIRWKDAVLESRKLRPSELSMIKYFDNIGFDRLIFNGFNKRIGKEFVVSVVSGLPIYYIYISYYFNTFIYEFFSLFRLFRFDLIVEFFDSFSKLANFTFNHRLHLRGLIERDSISMYNFGREVFKFMNNSFIELEKQYKSSLFFNENNKKWKSFSINNDVSSYDDNWLFLFYNGNDKYDFLKVSESSSNREFRDFFLFNKYTYVNFIRDYLVIDDSYNNNDININFNKVYFIKKELSILLKFYLDEKEDMLSFIFNNDMCSYWFNNWLISLSDGVIFLGFWLLYCDDDNNFNSGICINRFIFKDNLFCYCYSSSFFNPSKLFFEKNLLKYYYNKYIYTYSYNYLDSYNNSSSNVYYNKLFLFFRFFNRYKYDYIIQYDNTYNFIICNYKFLLGLLFYNYKYIYGKYYFFEIIEQLKFMCNRYFINNYMDIVTIFNNFSLLYKYTELYDLYFLSFFSIKNELVNKVNLFLLFEFIYCKYYGANVNFLYDIFFVDDDKLRLEFKLYLFDKNWSFIDFIDKENILFYIKNNIFFNGNYLLGNFNYDNVFVINNGIFNFEVDLCSISNVLNVSSCGNNLNLCSKIEGLINIDLVKLLNHSCNNNLLKLLSSSSIISNNDDVYYYNNLKDEISINNRDYFLTLIKSNYYFNKIDFFNLKTYVDFPSVIMWYSDSFFSKYLLFDNNPLNCLVEEDDRTIVTTTAICDSYYSNCSSKLYFLINSIQKFINFSFSSMFLYKLISVEDLLILINININNKQVCFFTLENFNFYVSLIMDYFMNSKMINLLYNRLLYEVMYEVYYNLYGSIVDINSIFIMYLEYFNIFTNINVTLYNKLLCNANDIDVSRLSLYVRNTVIVYDVLYLDFLKKSWSYDVLRLFRINLVEFNNILVKYYNKFNLSLENRDIFNCTLNDEFNYRKLYSDIDFIKYVDINSFFSINSLNNNNSSTIESNFVNVVLPILDFKIETLMSSANFFNKRLNLVKLSFDNKKLNDDLFYLILGKYLSKNKSLCIEIKYSKLFNLISYFDKYNSNNINNKYFGNGNVWYWPDYIKYSIIFIEKFEQYFNTLIYSSKLGFRSISSSNMKESSEILDSVYSFFNQFCKEVRYFAFNKNKGHFLSEIYNYSDSEFIEEFYYYYIKLYIKINELLINYELFKRLETGLLVYDKTKSLADDYSLIGKVCDTHSLLLGLMNFKLHMMKEFISFRYSLSLLLIDFPKFYFFFDIKESEFLENINIKVDNLKVTFFNKDDIDKFDYKGNLIKLIKLIEFYSGKFTFRFLKNEFLSLFDSLLDGDKYENFIFNYYCNLNWDERKSFFYFYTKYNSSKLISFSTNFVVNINISFIDYFKNCLLNDFTATVRVSGYTGIDMNPFMISKLYKGFENTNIYKYVSSGINIYNKIFFSYLPITCWDLHKFIMCEENCNFLQFLMIKEFNVMFLYQLSNFEAISCRLSTYLNRFIQNIELYRISLLKEPETLALYFSKSYQCIDTDEKKKFFESFNRNMFFIDSLREFLENLSLTIDKNCFNFDKFFKVDYKIRFITTSIEKFYLSLIKDRKRSGYTSFLEDSLMLRNFNYRFKFLKQLLLQIKVSAGLLNSEDCIKFFYSLWYNYADFLNHKVNFEWLSSNYNIISNDSSFLFITAGPNISENDMFFFAKYSSEEDGELARRLISETQCYVDYRILKHLLLNNENDFFINLFDKYISSSNKKEICTFLFPIHGFKFFDYYIGKPELDFFGIYRRFYSSWILENYKYFFISRANASVINSISYLFIKMNNDISNVNFFVSTVNRVFEFMSKLIEVQHKSIRGILLDELKVNVVDRDNLCNVSFSKEKLINLVLLNNFFHKEFYKIINVGIGIIEYKLFNDNILSVHLNNEVLFDINAGIKKIRKLLLGSDEMLALLRSCIRFYCCKNGIQYNILDVYCSKEDRFNNNMYDYDYIIDIASSNGVNFFNFFLLNNDYYVSLYNEDKKMREVINNS